MLIDALFDLVIICVFSWQNVEALKLPMMRGK